MEHISKKNLRLIIEDLLFEDVHHGMYDQSGPSLGDPDKDDDDENKPDITVPADVPLKPTNMMARQLADERPPIEDEEYSPTNVKELERASASLAALVPDDQVEFFYKEMHRLVDKAAEKHNTPQDKNNPLDDESGSEDTPLDAKKDKSKEEKLKGESRLREAPWEDDNAGYSDQEYDEAGMSILEDEDFPEFEEAAEELVAQTPVQSGDATFEKIADEFGFAGAPGARQHIDKILKRMNYFAVQLERDEISALMDTAVEAFIDALSDPKIGMFEPEDVEVLQSQPQSVKELDSFRFFLVAAFIMPGFQAVQKAGRKKLEAYLDSSGVPKELWQTVVNQATGGAERNAAKLAKKIGKVSAKLGLSEEEAVQLGDNLEGSFADLLKMAQPESGLVDIAVQRWSGLSRQKQLSIAVQSMNQTVEEFEELGIDVQDPKGLDGYINTPTSKGHGPQDS
jgi:hypothetical protein